MKYILFICLSILLIETSYTQTQGLVIQTGLTSGFSKDNNVTKSGEAHYGWMVGADARILEGGMYFIIGGQYHQTSLISTKKADFFKNDWKILMGRGGLGFNIINFSERIVLRSKILGSVNFIMDTTSPGVPLPGYGLPDPIKPNKNDLIVNDSFLGVTSGIGLTLGSLDIDLEYQYGVINAIKAKPDSKYSYITLMAGFHF
ncbi:MAG: hypothetical protein WAT22_15625 [Saprospiraceae bacterium]